MTSFASPASNSKFLPYLVALIAAVFALLLANHAQARLQQIENMIDVEIDGNHSAETIKKALMRAAAKRNWAVKRIGPGHLRALQNSRGLMAKVDIHFTPKKYSITYHSSDGLKFKEPDLIHRRYNGWIKNLNADIQSQLFSL